MKTTLIICTFLVSHHVASYGQGSKHRIKTVFLNADSVKILSHRTISGIRITKKLRDEQDLVRNGKLNFNIVNKISVLDHKFVLKVIEILTRVNSDKEIDVKKSFTPHNGLFLYKNGKISFMDIDFGARQLYFSKNLQIDDDLSKSSWADFGRL